MRLKVILISSFILLNLAVFLVTGMVKEKRIEKSLSHHLERLQTDYNTLRYHQKLTVQTVYESTKEKIIPILSKVSKVSLKEKNRLREKLYNTLKKKYKVMTKRGIYQFQFVLPNNKTFLRLHKPSKYDDDLTEVRYTYKYVNEKKKPIDGFEGGKTTHAYRYVIPIFDHVGNYLCAMEVSFSSNYLQNYLTQISKLHTHFILYKNIFSKETWDRDDIKIQYKQSAEHEDYMLMMSKQHTANRCITENHIKIENIKENIKINMAKKKPFSVHTKHKTKDGTHIDVISFLPIKSTQGKNLAWLVSHEIDDHILMVRNGSNVVRIILFILFSILFFILFKILNQKKELEQIIQTKTKELQDLNKNLEKRIENEVEINRQNEIRLLEKSKMSSLGEMIGNIAHQWRQPLNVISAATSTLELKYTMKDLDKETLDLLTKRIIESTQHLSKTIDTFRSFIKDDKERKEVELQETIRNSINIVESTLKSNYIELYHNLDNLEPILYTLVEGEINQVIINILNNAKDILNEKKPENPWIDVNLSSDDKNVLITIEDNAGGIKNDIIPKIFDPYFTTKHKSQGTGLGLHMSYKIITESLNGEIYVENTKKGAKFFISLPL